MAIFIITYLAGTSNVFAWHANLGISDEHAAQLRIVLCLDHQQYYLANYFKKNLFEVFVHRFLNFSNFLSY